MVHAVTVDPYQGEGGMVTIYGPTAGPVPCFIDDTRAMVRTMAGDTVVSETTLYVVDKAWTGSFPPESIVHLPGRDATVIKVSNRDSGDLGLPDHLKIALT
ncbi:hypothetical protein [Arthrobacter sp. GMC3]|uniref:hypothetical protein n=1 Tax=Arthrobacter sp. GMC3 TaxID=2058894 RepID=UPI0015E3F8C2|nr:hypothetical protein [Arthrobacter sp. GMC3]